MHWLLSILVAHSETPGSTEALDAAVDLVQERYPQVDRDALYRAAISGVASYLDDITGEGTNHHLTARQHDEQLAWLRGERQGIGVEYTIAQGHGMLLTDVYPDTPAAKAGLMQGDLVVAMNGHPFTGLSSSLIHQVAQSTELSGRSRVALDVRRGSSELRRIEVERGSYRVPEASVRTDGAQPLLVVPFFGEGTAEAASEALVGLGDRPGVVIDLRDNQGGLLEEAVATAELFLEPGSVIVHREHSDGGSESDVASEAPLWTGDVAVLVNRGTSGAAEAFAVALQDHRRATIIGTRTAGVATNDSYYPLGDGTWLQLADIYLLSPMGRSWSGTGISPDVVMEPVNPFRVAPGQRVPDYMLDEAEEVLDFR